jgi:multidrug efflux pump subunit AcrB
VINEDRAEHWLLAGCRHRVRPLLMKTDTTLLGVLPSLAVWQFPFLPPPLYYSICGTLSFRTVCSTPQVSYGHTAEC